MGKISQIQGFQRFGFNFTIYEKRKTLNEVDSIFIYYKSHSQKKNVFFVEQIIYHSLLSEEYILFIVEIVITRAIREGIPSPVQNYMPSLKKVDKNQ